MRIDWFEEVDEDHNHFLDTDSEVMPRIGDVIYFDDASDRRLGNARKGVVVDSYLSLTKSSVALSVIMSQIRDDGVVVDDGIKTINNVYEYLRKNFGCPTTGTGKGLDPMYYAVQKGTVIVKFQ